MMTPRDRYLNDPCFNSLVKSLLGFLYQSQCTLSEMREAVDLACTLYEEYSAQISFEKKLEEVQKL